MSVWQSIKTAPRDGTPFLGFRLGALRPNVMWWESGEGWQSDATMEMNRRMYAGYACCDPTHWMPLPSPPETDEVRPWYKDGINITIR